MSLLLIDTDITSFIFKGSDYADPYLPLLMEQELALSFMTVAELFYMGSPEPRPFPSRHPIPAKECDFVGGFSPEANV